MSNKKKDSLYSQWPDQQGRDFEEEDEVLNYKPKLQYEFPQDLDRETILRDTSTPLAEARKKVEDFQKAYQVIEKLAEIAQDRLDERVGDYRINLNDLVDYQAQEAIKRVFPEIESPTEITYDMYKRCVTRLHNVQNSTTVPVVTAATMAEAKNNPKKTQFGGLGAPAGENRKEVDSANSSGMKPIDLKAFQDSIVKKLHKLLSPMNDAATASAISKHKIDTPHG